MKVSRLAKALAALVLVATSAGSARAHAQGVTTGAVAGTVTDSTGVALPNVQIRIVNKATGFAAGSLSREDGRFLVQGLEIGGPYEVTARRIGFAPQVRDNQFIALSQVLRLDFKLSQQATQLAGVSTVASTRTETFAPTNTGTRTIISDSTLQRTATLTRNLTDFIRLTPQVSSSGPGYSAGGMSNRMNNVQIDGATERDAFGLGSTGQPGAEVNSKSVSIDAVKEFQVLLAPFDVRQGNFGGILLNAVTKSGTNQLQGSAFYFYRNEKYGADTTILRATPFDRTQYGFTLGGPIIKDRLHFFVAPEFQQENSPVTGPYLQQPASQTPPFPVSDSLRQRFESIMARLGETSLGTAGATNIENPLGNFFGRLDYRVNDTHRAVLRFNYSSGDRLRQQNDRNSTRAVYSSNFHDFANKKYAPVLQVFSNFSNGSSNELFLGYNTWTNRRKPLSAFPQITVTVPLVTGGNATILGGSDQFSQGNELDVKTVELTENYTIPRGSHTLTFGTRNEYVKLRNLFTQSSLGVWSFRNLDSLDAGNANQFRKAIILQDGGNVYFSALQSAFYAQDQWAVTPRFNANIGLRFDVSRFLDDVDYNAAIDSAYGRRTDDIPKGAVQFSPRVGFNWDLTGDAKNQIRGGAGLFVGTPPYVWLENAYVNSGNIITFLNCTTSSTPAPAFQRDPSGINVCRNGQGSKPIGDVNFLAKDLKFPQPFRATLAYDRQLPYDLVLTFEGLYSRTLNQLFFVNKNLAGPQGTDPHGRVLYASTFNPANGAPNTVLPAAVVANGGAARFSTAIDLQNQSKDYAYNLTTSLRKRYSNNWEAFFAYTYSRARDVQSFTSSTAISNWQFGRTLAGRQEDAFLGRSLFDQPHKVQASGSYTVSWLRNFTTDFALTYTGASGAPNDYVYSGTGAAGDLNGDGRNGNDLVYIPKSTSDFNEIQFRDIAAAGSRAAVSAAQQAAAFDQFIRNSSCLRDHRGEILPRNACRLPFFNTLDFSLRQGVRAFGDRRLAIQLDLFNFGNLLNENWGKQGVSEVTANANVPLLTHVGMSSADPKVAVPIVQYNVSQQEYIDGVFASNFWRSQISFRFSF